MDIEVPLVGNFERSREDTGMTSFDYCNVHLQAKNEHAALQQQVLLKECPTLGWRSLDRLVFLNFHHCAKNTKVETRSMYLLIT
jgi:hypothetical protein